MLVKKKREELGLKDKRRTFFFYRVNHTPSGVFFLLLFLFKRKRRGSLTLKEGFLFVKLFLFQKKKFTA